MPAFTTPDGRPSGAVYGFSNLVLRIMRELEPTWVVACFDAPGPTFREKEYPAYKATRSETPPEIIAQEPMVKAVLETLAVPHVAVSGFEADDLIATLTRQARDQGVEDIVIVTGDRDLLQLSQPGVDIYLMRASIKNVELLDVAAVTELCGLPPAELLDWKALRGDSSDNIVGVPGIGDKTALTLIKAYKTLEGLYAHIKAGETTAISPRIRQSLIDHKDRAFKNRDLLTVHYHAPVTLDLVAAGRDGYHRANAEDLLRSYGFKSILERLPNDPNNHQASLF